MALTDKELDLLIEALASRIAYGEISPTTIADYGELRAKLRAERKRIK